MCEEIKVLQRKESRLNGGKVDTIEYVWCKNYTGMKHF
jgi:hypothetical protein